MIAGRRRESPWGRRGEAENRPYGRRPKGRELRRLAERCGPIFEQLWPTVSAALAGEDPLVQGAVLGELTACWLAGHLVPGDLAATEQLREQVLEAHIAVVRQMVKERPRSGSGGSSA